MKIGLYFRETTTIVTNNEPTDTPGHNTS